MRIRRFKVPHLNKVLIMGHLGHDPSVTPTTNSKVAKFTVAVPESFTDSNGEKQKRTEWFRVSAWGKLADLCVTYLKKGDPVYIEGHQRTSEWVGKDGEKKKSSEVVAEEVQFLRSKPREEEKPTTPDDESGDLPF
jgi:single-strand DNA-binding protein